MRFEKLSQDSKSRLGKYKTIHGVFETPNFMPVATCATVKGLDIDRVQETGAQIILVNTYHLMLRPSSALVQQLGGIHEFSGWSGPILSDSGGFQIYSLPTLRKLREEGVDFQSHIDGAKHFVSPERAIEIQQELGVDIAMVLDECPAAGIELEAARKSLELTIRWAKRSLQARTNPDLSVFAITQGNTHQELRTYAAQSLSESNFDGFAIGGLSVGEPKEKMYQVLDYHPQQLPENKIRYLMGVGTPEDIVTAVLNGVDLFDCVMPTRAGRFGRAFIRGELPYLNIKNAQFKTDPKPLDPECNCLACRKYSRAYLHHLFKADEMLGPQMLSLHNVTYYQDLMRDIRKAIANKSMLEFYQKIKKQWGAAEADVVN